jgi:hypothetical protein
VSFVEAITELARKAGIALEGESGPRTRRRHGVPQAGANLLLSAVTGTRR